MIKKILISIVLILIASSIFFVINLNKSKGAIENPPLSEDIQYCKEGVRGNKCINCQCNTVSDCKLVINPYVISECSNKIVVNNKTSQNCLDDIRKTAINASCVVPKNYQTPKFDMFCVNHTCGMVLKQSGNTDANVSLIDKITSYVENTTVAKGFTGWKVIGNYQEIPYKQGDHSPDKYNQVIKPPELINPGDDLQNATLYAWTSDDGLLARWQISVEKQSKIVHINITVLDVAIGTVKMLRTEGFIPAPGIILINEPQNINLP